MKFKEISEMSSEELQTKRRDIRQESLHLRLQQQSGQLEQPSRLRLLRRQVAQIETVLSQRSAKTEAK
ncbi:MAG TPA: 50S ribosomal protein L29 [Chthoniobacterales bacterium]|nr:50S ribosomal protein L29 [Chthoniobacterales bacterium]